MADGEYHCILPYQRFHTEKSGKDGKLFKTWLMEHADHMVFLLLLEDR